MNETRQPPFIEVTNNATAPFIYFDHAPIYGVHHGTLEVELVARTIVPTVETGTRNEFVYTAHLRCGPDAARELINALAKALAALSRPTDVQSN